MPHPFDDDEPIDPADMTPAEIARESALLATQLTERRCRRIEEVLEGRTTNLCLVLENLHDPFNVSACLRTAEAFGLQDVFIIEETETVEVHKDVSRRTEKWLTISRSDDRREVVEHLAEGGFQLLVATPEPGAGAVGDVADIDRPIAVAFGNELKGVSDELVEMAGGRFHIPMVGFVESLNVTVSVAISLREVLLAGLAQRPLSQERKDRLRLEWLRSCVHPRVREELLTRASSQD